VSWSDNEAETRKLLEEFRSGQALIDEPKFKDSIRQGLETAGTIFYFRAHGRNAKTWFHAKETWERYDYLYSREEVQQHAQKIKAAASTPGVQKAFAFYNNHAKAQAPANAIMLSQELGVRLKGMPPEAMVSKFPELVQGIKAPGSNTQQWQSTSTAPVQSVTATSELFYLSPALEGRCKRSMVAALKCGYRLAWLVIRGKELLASRRRVPVA
jgi:hypothetical protein